MNPPRMLAVDIETSGLDWRSKVLSIGAAWLDDEGHPTAKTWLLGTHDLFHPADSPPLIAHELRQLIQTSDLVVMHNASFDTAYLLGNALIREEDIQGKLFDTLVTARMTAARDSLSLASLCDSYQLSSHEAMQRYHTTPAVWGDFKKKRKDMLSVGVENLLTYNGIDAMLTLDLGHKLWADATALYSPEFIRRESDFCRVMAKIRVRGKAVDRTKIMLRLAELQERANQINKEILMPVLIKGVNDRTGIIDYLKRYGFSGFPRTEKGNESVDKDALAEIAHKVKGTALTVVEAVLEARKIEKLTGTYLLPILSDHVDDCDRIHPSYSVGGAMTYRLSSSNPNGQNVPRDLDIWAPYLSFDYSQAELRLAAAYAQENQMAGMFSRDEDIHQQTAILLWGAQNYDKEKRSRAKSINFGTLYGGGAKALVDATGLEYQQAFDFLIAHRRLFPALYRMSKTAQKKWEADGFVRLWNGKRIYATKFDLERSYKAFNNIIQGGVGAIVQEAMLQMDEAGVEMVGQTHDEVGVEPGTDQATVLGIMNNLMPEQIGKRTAPPIAMKVDVTLKGDTHV